MAIFDKISDAASGISKKTKSVSNSNNLKKKIAYEQERIQEIFAEIGEKFYADRTGDHKELVELCENIDQRKNRIRNMNVEVNAIKGKRICPKCHSKFEDSLEFCGHCGSRLIILEEE